MARSLVSVAWTREALMHWCGLAQLLQQQLQDLVYYTQTQRRNNVLPRVDRYLRVCTR